MRWRSGPALRGLAASLLALGLSGCFQPAITRPTEPSAADPQHARVVFTALQMVGVPYRYGGSSPEGFDCSGLVQYAYRSAGISVPRTSREQLQASSPIRLSEAGAGDLLFFRTGDSSHVGIYLGDGRFVHAPFTGRNVEITSLADPYYQRGLVQVGRIAAQTRVAQAGCPESTSC